VFDAIGDIVLNNLYKLTQLQDSFGVIMLALANGVPKVMNLKEMLIHFLDFRRVVVIRRTKFELIEAEDRAHILEGLKVALENIDTVIGIIRGSKNPEEARNSLIEKFKFSEKQTKAILDNMARKYYHEVIFKKSIKIFKMNMMRCKIKQKLNDRAYEFRVKRHFK
jgi:DNA gyrase subunit A